LLWLFFHETFYRTEKVKLKFHRAIEVFISAFQHRKIRELSVVFFVFILVKYFAKRFSSQGLIKLCALLSVLSFFASAWHLGLLWLNIWRILAGFTSAFVTILTPVIILQATPKQHKSRVSGIMYCGVGLIIIASGIAMPYLVKEGASFAWLIIGVTGLLMTMIAWRLLPQPLSTPPSHTPIKIQKEFYVSIPFTLLLVAYMQYGIGVVPHGLFIVQYIANHLHYGNYLGSIAWIFYGTGILICPPAIGSLAHHMGTRVCLVVIYLLAIIALALPLVSNALWVLYLSTFLAGGLGFTIISLTASRLSEIMQGHSYTIWWGYATAAFALTQALAAYLMSSLLTLHDGYPWIFSIGAMAFTIAFILMIINLILKRPLRDV